MTARQIIERRLGHKLPPTRELAPDERQAIKRLAVALLHQKAAQNAEEIAAFEREAEIERQMLAGRGPAFTMPHDPRVSYIWENEYDG